MMKRSRHIQWIASKKTPQCKKCIFFESDPAVIEKTFKGLTILSSGYGSVRSDDGLCLILNRYLSSRDSCGGYIAADRRHTD